MTEEKEHPAFPQPENPSTDLWRYLDFGKFEWLIENKRLFMPVTEEFGDLLEGTRPTGDHEWWQDQITKEEDNYKKEIIKNNSKIILDISRLFKNNYFISCWHMNSNENEEMWKHYTKSSDSLAVCSTYNNLKSLLPGRVNIGVVRYIDYKTDKLPTFNLFEYITHKDISYIFESEVRVVAAALTEAHYQAKTFKDNIFELEMRPGFIFFAPVIDLLNLIQSIVFHPEASEEFKQNIKDLCLKNGLPNPRDSML